MPIVITAKNPEYKDKLPDKFMKLKLTDEEMERYLKVFPEFERIKTPIDQNWEPATIEVIMKISAFKKKLNGD